LPGAVLLGVLTMILIATDSARPNRTFVAMSLCAPLVDLIAIVRDGAVDPTSHNLAPFELILSGLLGAAFVLPGLALGLALRAWRRRRSA